MAAFRVLDQAPQYLLADGSVNAGGKLTFYETDLTTPKNTWSDKALSVLNSNPVIMDAAGRTLTDVWGDGEYGVVMSDADDNVIWTRNNVQGGAGDPSLEIPTPLDVDYFLTNDGSSLLWRYVRQVADPAGHAGQVYFSDGELGYWGALPNIPDLPADGIDDTPTSVRIGTTLQQWGSDTFPATGGQETSKAVTFGEEFSGTPTFIVIQLGLGTDMYLMTNVASQSTTGFTAGARTDILGAVIDAAQPFRWFACGPVTP